MAHSAICFGNLLIDGFYLQPMSMVLPGVVGFKLSGKLRNGVTATDLVLTVTQMLRKHGVVGKFVEFYGNHNAFIFNQCLRMNFYWSSSLMLYISHFQINFRARYEWIVTCWSGHHCKHVTRIWCNYGFLPCWCKDTGLFKAYWQKWWHSKLLAVTVFNVLHLP